MPLRKDIDQLNREIKVIEYGCYTAMGIGLLGLIFSPSTEGKVLFGMLLASSIGIRTAPASIDFLDNIFGKKE